MTVSGPVENLIAARNAQHHAVSTSPFGPTDEIGMLNLITPQHSAAALSAADTSRCFDLSVDLFPGMPTWTVGGEPPFQIAMTHTPAGSVVDDPIGVGPRQHQLVSWSADQVAMFTHCGTHVDALNHFGYHGVIWNGFRADEHLGSMHWTKAGPDKHPPTITRGVLFDVAAALGYEVLPDSFPIGSDELQEVSTKYELDVQPGDVVLIRTGRGSVWPDPTAYLPLEPGLNLDGARWLAVRGASMIGADNIALEHLPSADLENWLPVHTYLLAEAGVPILEVVNLEELSAARCYRFCYLGAPLRIRGATGGPVRPFAFAWT